MTVNELIEKLKTLNPDATVKVWDPFNDEETTIVVVSHDRNSDVYIADSAIGISGEI